MISSDSFDAFLESLEGDDEDTECGCGGGGEKLERYGGRCYDCELEKLTSELASKFLTRREFRLAVTELDHYCDNCDVSDLESDFDAESEQGESVQICEKCGVAKPEKFDAPGTDICRDCIHAYFYESADEEPEAPPPKKARSPVHADQVAVLPPAPVREVIDLTQPCRIRITIDLTGPHTITSFDI
jgi:hypothetical protein